MEAEPTFCGPDLDAFCGLDRLGLSVTGKHVGIDHTVLACRVLEPDEVTDRSCSCQRCGQLGVPRGTVLRQLAHVPVGGGRRSCTSPSADTAATGAPACGART